MGMNMSEKILAKHAGLSEVHPGQLITCDLDMVLANDITAPPSIAKFEEIGRPVFDPAKIALVPDHFQPAKDIKSAGLAKIVRDFAHKHHIVNYFEQGAWASSMSSCRRKGWSALACSRSVQIRILAHTAR